MIFPAASNAAETIDNPKSKPLGKSLAFDYEAKRFRLVDGSPVLVSGVDALGFEFHD